MSLEIPSWLSDESGPDLSHLRTLYCDCDGPNRALLHQLGGHLQLLCIRAPFLTSGISIRSSLITFALHSHSSLAELEDSLLLEHLTGLRSLQVTRINIRDPTSHPNYSGPSWLKQLLQSILSAADLQHIKIKVMVDEDSIIPCDVLEAAVDSTFDRDARSRS